MLMWLEIVLLNKQYVKISLSALENTYTSTVCKLGHLVFTHKCCSMVWDSINNDNRPSNDKTVLLMCVKV